MEQNTKETETTEREQLYLNELKLLQADFINFRNRMEKERSQIEECAQNRIVIKFLEIKDNFERAELDEGMKIIYNQILKIFKDLNIEETEECPEIVGVDKEPKLIQKGYKRNNILLRPAKVVIGGKNE
jgi:molecular chaperone GrpE